MRNHQKTDRLQRSPTKGLEALTTSKKTMAEEKITDDLLNPRERSRNDTPVTQKQKINEVSLMMERMREVSNLDERTNFLESEVRRLLREQTETSKQIENYELQNYEDKKMNKRIEKFMKKFLLRLLNKGMDSRSAFCFSSEKLRN